MLNDDTSSHRYVAREHVPACDRSSDLSLVSSTICCTNSTPFPSSCPPHCCPTSADALASSSSRGQGIFTQKEPFDSGTLWSSSSISRAYGIIHSSVPRKGRRLYLTSSACVRCYLRFHACFLYPCSIPTKHVTRVTPRPGHYRVQFGLRHNLIRTFAPGHKHI